jgi:hypothetical protein
MNNQNKDLLLTAVNLANARDCVNQTESSTYQDKTLSMAMYCYTFDEKDYLVIHKDEWNLIKLLAH